MESLSKTERPSKRVIIRVHEHWHDQYLQILQDWFQHCGYAMHSERYEWTNRHYVHLGGVNQHRFHLIIDMERNGLKDPRLDDIPYEVYRLRKPNESIS